MSRHEVVEYFLEHSKVYDKITQHLKQIGDVERLISKVATGKVCPREVIQLKNSLKPWCRLKRSPRMQRMKRCRF